MVATLVETRHSILAATEQSEVAHVKAVSEIQDLATSIFSKKVTEPRLRVPRGQEQG